MAGARATVAARPPLRTIPSTRCDSRPPAPPVPGRVPRSATSAETSSSTRSPLCSSSRTSAADRAALWSGFGIPGGDQGPGVVAGQPDGAGVVRVHRRAAHPVDRVALAQVVGGGEAVERRQRREPAGHRGRGGAGVEHPGGVQVHLDRRADSTSEAVVDHVAGMSCTVAGLETTFNRSTGRSKPCAAGPARSAPTPTSRSTPPATAAARYSAPPPAARMRPGRPRRCGPG